VSGGMSLSTGDATDGGSGDFSVVTGDATNGNGGNITLAVGIGSLGNGGDVLIAGGDTSAASSKGGDVVLRAGDGTNSQTGEGGDITIDSGSGSNSTVNGDVFIGITSKSVTMGRTDNANTIDMFGDVTVSTNATLKVHNSGAELKGHFSATTAFTSVAISASQARVEFMNLPNAQMGDIVHCTFDAAIGVIMTSASMYSAEYVQIVMFNPTAAPITVPSSNIRCSAWQY